MKQAAIPPEKKSVAIITARGGSKRIPHKNIRDFCGKPIISYSIEAALSSDVFDEVMVSTDDEQLLPLPGALEPQSPSCVLQSPQMIMPPRMM